MAIHRFTIIRFDPFNKRNLATAPRCIAVCIVIWIIPVGTFITIKTFNKDARVETLIFPIITFASHAICVVCYTIVYSTIASSARKAGLSDRMLVRRIKQNKQILTTFALVVGTNVVCWFPLSLSFFISYIRPDWVFNLNTFRLNSWFRVFANVSRGLLGLNGILNPIIYWTRLTDFRNLIGLPRCCKSASNASSSEPESAKNDLSLQTQDSSIPDPQDCSTFQEHGVYAVST